MGRRMNLLISFCLMIISVGFIAGSVAADEIFLANGDRLTGRIVEIKDNLLILETDYSEPLKLKFEAVTKMTSSEPVELHLSNGEIFKGRVSTNEQGLLVVDAEQKRQPVTLEFASIKALNPPPKKPATWKGNITLGGSWQDGNSETVNIAAGAQATRRTENDRFKLNFLYNFAKDDGERTAENTYGQLKYDYFLNPRWYLYLNLDMLSDEFQDINLRTSVGPGVGYQVWEEDKRSLSFEAGVAYTSEDRDMGEDSDWVTARLGADFEYRLFERVTFSDQFVIYPSLDDTGEYTLRNEAALITDIGSSWASRLSNIWKRDSDPGPGIESDDFTWILGLQYTF